MCKAGPGLVVVLCLPLTASSPPGFTHAAMCMPAPQAILALGHANAMSSRSSAGAHLTITYPRAATFVACSLTLLHHPLPAGPPRSRPALRSRMPLSA